MAEILVCVTNERRPDERFQDGDIVAAFNDRRISRGHLHRICDPTQLATRDGLRPVGTAAQYMMEQIAQYRFERVSKGAVRRTVLATGASDIISARPNEAGEYMDVELYVTRRLAHPRHKIFGQPGREIWYGGNADYSAAKLDTVWARVEADKIARKADHTKWPLTPTERRNFLPAPVADMRDAVVERLMAVEYDYDEKQPEYNPEVGPTIVRKRRVSLNWKELGVAETTVLDQSREVDLRAEREPLALSVVQVKPRVNQWSVRDHLTADRDFLV